MKPKIWGSFFKHESCSWKFGISHHLGITLFIKVATQAKDICSDSKFLFIVMWKFIATWQQIHQIASGPRLHLNLILSCAAPITSAAYRGFWNNQFILYEAFSLRKEFNLKETNIYKLNPRNNFTNTFLLSSNNAFK